MTQISEEERKLLSQIAKGFARIEVETGNVLKTFNAWPQFDEPLGRIRKKFIPNRRVLGLRDRFDWEIQEQEARIGLYQEQPCLPSLVPYATN
jgi:hypothetical protein